MSTFDPSGSITPNMDYKHLLIKYMQHLQQLEETVFLELVNGPFSPNVNFTAEEMKALREIETQVQQPSGLKEKSPEVKTDSIGHQQ